MLIIIIIIVTILASTVGRHTVCDGYSMTRTRKSRRYNKLCKEEVLILAELVERFRKHYELEAGTKTIASIRALMLDAGQTCTKNQVIPTADGREGSTAEVEMLNVAPKDGVSRFS
jgi:hypothetical protein